MSPSTPIPSGNAGAPESPNAAEHSPPLDAAPRFLGRVLAKRPLIFTESVSDYDELLAGVVSAIKPTDIIEEIAVKVFTDLTWGIELSKRLRAKHLTEGVHAATRERSQGIEAAREPPPH